MTVSLLVACLSLTEPSAAALREAVVTVTVENMYAAADDATAVVSQATLGDVVEVLETSGAFAAGAHARSLPGLDPARGGDRVPGRRGSALRSRAARSSRSPA